MSEKNANTAENKLVKSALWCMSARWVMKIFGLISTSIMVRLLAPEDFGLIAKAIIILGFFEIFIQTKFSFGLVRLKDPTREDYDTVFTLNVILGVFIFMCIHGIAFFSDVILQDPDIPILVHILSLRTLFYMFESPRIMDLQRDLYFEKDFYYLISHKILSIIFSVSLCFYFRDYRGLLYAYLINAMLTTLLSHVYMPYRPRLTLQNKSFFLNFSLPSMRSHFVSFIASIIDRFLPARYISDKAMGIYNFAYELSFQLTHEIVFPLSRALFPIFSNIEDDKKSLSQHYHYVHQLLIALCSAIGIGLYLTAEKLVLLYAGEQWREAIPFFQILSLVGAAHVFNQMHGSIFEGTGHVRIKEKLIIAQFIVMVIAMLPFIININLYYMACAKLVATCLFSVIYTHLSIRFYDISLSHFLTFYSRTILALIAMIYVHDVLWDHLLLQVIGCMVAFLTVHFGLWSVTRNPNMIEAKLLGLISSRMPKWIK